MMNRKSAAAVATLSLLVFLASSPTAAASKSDDATRKHQRRRRPLRHTGKESESDALRDERTLERASWVMLSGGSTEVQIIKESTENAAVAPVQTRARTFPQFVPADPKSTTMPLPAGDASKRFCGRGWSDVTLNCLTATPCPRGHADCPDGTACIDDTPCSDEVWLERLGEMQPDRGAPDASACASPGDCPRGQFCAESDAGGGHCATCLPSGRGCSTDEICATSPGGELKCYDRPSGAGNANVQRWQPQREDPPARGSRPASNDYFCGVSYAAITGSCPRSKPCPSGVASVHCGPGERCFSHPGCRERHDAAAYDESTRASFAAMDISVEMFSQEEAEAFGARAGDSSKEGGGESDGHWKDAGNIMFFNAAAARRGSVAFFCSAFALGGYFVM